MVLSEKFLKGTLLVYYYTSLAFGYAVFSLSAQNKIIDPTHLVRFFSFIFSAINVSISVFTVFHAFIVFHKVARRVSIEMHLPLLVWSGVVSLLVQTLFYMQATRQRKLRLMFRQFQKLYIDVARFSARGMFHRKHLFLLLLLICDRAYIVGLSAYFHIRAIATKRTFMLAYKTYFAMIHNTTIRIFEVGHILGVVIMVAICDNIREDLENCAKSLVTREGPLDVEQYQRLVRCRHFLLQVYYVKNEFSKQLSFCTFLYYFLTFLDLIVTFHSYFTRTIGSTTYTTDIVFFVLFLTRAHLFAYTAESHVRTFNRAVERVLEIANKRRSQLMSDEYLIQLFSKDMDYKDKFGFLKINRGLTLGMFASVISYIVILVQFNIQSKKDKLKH